MSSDSDAISLQDRRPGWRGRQVDAVLTALSDGISLDLPQISSEADLPVDEVEQVVAELVEADRVQEVAPGEGTRWVRYVSAAAQPV